MPNASYLESNEGYASTKFNSIGFNDREPLLGKGLNRIFVVGDSYTEAFQVTKEKGYVQLLENYLNKQGKEHTFDVIKIGRDGFYPAHYPFAIDRFFSTYSPDMILLQFGSHSSGDMYADDVLVSYENNEIISIDIKSKKEYRQKEILRPIINNSALLFFLMRKYKANVEQLLDNFRTLFRDAKSNKRHDNKKKKSLEDRILRLDYVISQIEKLGVKVVLFYIPRPGSYLKPDKREESATLMALSEIAKKRSMLLINLTDDFKNHYRIKNEYLNGFSNTLPATGHLNTTGHKVAAESIYKVLSGPLTVF